MADMRLVGEMETFSAIVFFKRNFFGFFYILFIGSVVSIVRIRITRDLV